MMQATNEPGAKAIVRFLAKVNKELENRGLGRIIIVGGYATELYSGAAYRTGDVDVIIDTLKVKDAKAIFDVALVKVGARKRSGRVYEAEIFGVIALDIVGYDFKGKVKRLRVNNSYVYVESPEDNIVTNLNACVYWNSDLDCEKAAAVLAAQWRVIDWNYLEERCKKERTLKKLREIKRRIKESMGKNL